MDKEQILKLFRALARSQGFYGRLLENITDKGLEHLEEQNFKDELDLILFLES